MIKYHINNKGEPDICLAKSNCPFGGPETHYKTLPEAKEAARRMLENEYQILPTKESKVELSNKAFEREVAERVKSLKKGIIRDYKEDTGYISINPNEAFSEEFEENYKIREKVEEYFSFKIKELEGDVLIGAKIEEYRNIQWYSVINQSKDFYRDGHENWTEESYLKLERDLVTGDKAYLYFAERLDLVDDIIKRVEEKDWTKYFNSQEEGVINVLKRLHESKLASQ